MNLFTIGTQGRKPEHVASILREAGVDILVDVRATPNTMHDPCHGALLSQEMAAHGIVYWAERSLGVPSAIRKHAPGLFDKHRLAWVLDWYRAKLDAMTPEVERSFLRVNEAVRSCRAVALLCYERDASTCHRSVLADILAGLVDDLHVVHL